MESSPSKRRKLSALTSIAPNAALEQSAPDSRQLTPNQASFLSPTKASLARFNPNLLPQVKSAGAKTKGPYGRSTAVSQEDVQKEGLRSFQDPVRSPLHPTTPTRNQMRVELTRVWSSSEERRLALLMVGVTASPTSKSSTRNRASASANPIPPSPASDSLQSIAQVSKTNERDAWYRATKESQSGSRAVSAPPLESEGAPTYGPGKSMQISEGEPALPLTPTQLGLEKAPEPPRGLLYSSPLRKMAKRKSSGLKSSPLKPRDDAPELLETACKEASQTCTREIVDSEHEGTDDLKKTRELEALREQLKGLQGDVDLLEQELGLLGASDWKDCSDLVSIITSANPTHLPVARSDFAEPISSRLALFLPFSKIPVAPKATTVIRQEPVPSHRSIQLESPVPYLRAFTPFTVTSIETLVPQSGTDSSLLKHVDIRLRSPQNVLQVELRLSVSPETESVEALSLRQLSSWAKPELETWTQKLASKCDLSTIGWACGRYWDVACIRAKCWNRCYQKFGDLVPHPVGSDGKAVGIDEAQVPVSRRRGSSRNAENRSDEGSLSGNDGQESGAEEPHDKLSMSRSTLLVHIGRTSLLFSRSNISLLISWRIDFDWTGEPVSDVSASASYPKSWVSTDTRASLDNVGRLFDRLVRKLGVYGAVTVIVPLLFEDY